MRATTPSAFFPSGHWASNIGNAFFNLGTEHILSSCGISTTHYDLPPYKAFGTESGCASSVHYQVDKGANFLVLDGPMFDSNFSRLFEPYLRNARASGLKIALLSTGMINYDETERDHCLRVLDKYQPDVITTRDSQTFEVFKSAAREVYDGICHAWFVADAYPGFEAPEALVSTFDHAKEPNFTPHAASLREIASGVPALAPISVRHSRFSKVTRLLQRDFAPCVDEMPIVRACHQVLARGNWRLFYKPNIVCAQTPYVYLNIYRNSLVTLTDRLHASVATLAYGRPAILFNKSNRCYLLDRLGLSYQGGKPMFLDADRLAHEKDAYKRWLKAALCD